MLSYKAKVSIVIPVYNIEAYIAECIDSLVRQTYPNLEIILVDDGSLDKSGEICDRYAKQDKRIRVIHQENGGLSCAVNKGMEHATGDFLFFVDGDDWIIPSAVEYVLTLQETYQADLVIFDFAYSPDFTQDPEYLELTDNIGALENLFIHNKKLPNIRLMTTIRWCKLYKRDVLTGITFPEGRKHEDEIAHEILYKAKNVVYTNQKCYFYRQRSDSIMHNIEPRQYLDKLQSFKERVLFLQKIQQVALLQPACDKFVYLLIQVVCKCDGIMDDNVSDEVEKKLEQYYTWIIAYKSYLGLKARAEIFLYRYCPCILKKAYKIRHKL